MSRGDSIRKTASIARWVSAGASSTRPPLPPTCRRGSAYFPRLASRLQGPAPAAEKKSQMKQ
jgi:hypothetical protein